MKSIVARNLKKKYGNTYVLDDISFELKEGKVYGLMGKNGAGKTTIIKMLCGLIKADEGHIIGNKIRVGALIEEPAAYCNLTAKENLQIFMNCIGKYDNKKIEKILQLVGLNDDKKKFKDYSLGMKKRLGIAVALVNNPDFLVLDEPSCGLDINGVIETRNIVKEFMKSENKITLISSHDTRDLVELCDEIMIIHKGRLISKLNHIERDSLKLEKIYLETIKEKKSEGN